MDKRVKRAAGRVGKRVTGQASNRKARTLSLDDDTFRELQVYCVQQGLQANRIIDELIAEFLTEVRDSKDS